MVALVASITCFSSCAKEAINPLPSIETTSTDVTTKKRGKLLVKDVYRHNGRDYGYKLYDLQTENSAVFVEMTDGRNTITFTVQQGIYQMGYDIVYNVDDEAAWCWECIGECVESVVDDHTALVVVMTPFCPECTVAFVGGAILGCTANQIEAAL